MLLIDSGQKTGNVLESYQRDIKAVAKSNESGSFDRSVNIQNSSEKRGLIGDDADRKSAEPGESDDDIRRLKFLNFKKIIFVCDAVNDVADVVGRGWLFGNGGI